ncbi:olfactory receptor 8D1-like [Hyperolius riggenbachi]|uniref:olfactory receptor 8D1-like n=1 Tax=Hyperolius riggenbachi TaxID=752182 RepID=UPI0035A2F523
MDMDVNLTRPDSFVLLGLTTNSFIQRLLFVLFSLIYTCSFLSNLGLILLIRTFHHLHTPMYFFLSHLSFVDLCYSSTITPKVLADFISDTKSISFIGCAAQMFSFAVFVISESYLVTAMAYDRFVAICQPLVYHSIMNKHKCWTMVSGAYIISFLAAVSHTITIFYFPLCGSHSINHYFCDIPPLLKLMCTYSYLRKLVMFVVSLFMWLACVPIILMSYVSIISTVLGISSAEGRSKAFSTCASHLAVVISFYGAAFGIYLQPILGLSWDNASKVFSIFYTVVSPLINPLIYSFKNAEVKKAITTLLCFDQILRHS